MIILKYDPIALKEDLQNVCFPLFFRLPRFELFYFAFDFACVYMISFKSFSTRLKAYCFRKEPVEGRAVHTPSKTWLLLSWTCEKGKEPRFSKKGGQG